MLLFKKHNKKNMLMNKFTKETGFIKEESSGSVLDQVAKARGAKGASVGIGKRSARVYLKTFKSYR